MLWGAALGGPLVGWCLLGFGRVALYLGQHRVADGWDEARQDDLISQTRQGRRSQQLLGVSLYTALRAPGAPPTGQLEALLDGNASLEAQPASQGESPRRHSRLPGDRKDPEMELLRVLLQVLEDLRQTLEPLPDATPLALLL